MRSDDGRRRLQHLREERPSERGELALEQVAAAVDRGMTTSDHAPVRTSVPAPARPRTRQERSGGR